MRHCFQQKISLISLLKPVDCRKHKHFIKSLSVRPKFTVRILFTYLDGSQTCFIELKNCRVRICILWATDMSRWPQYLAQQQTKKFLKYRNTKVSVICHHTPTPPPIIAFSFACLLCYIWKVCGKSVVEYWLCYALWTTCVGVRP